MFIFTLFVVSGPSTNVLASPDAVAPNLGTAASFVGLAYSTLTNTGPGVFVGNVGAATAGSSVVGFPPGKVIQGSIHMGDAAAIAALADASTAYTTLQNEPCNVHLTGQDLGGLTLTPGVYCFDTSAQLTGNLVLDALGNSLAVWVFQTGSTLTTASGSTVGMINGGHALNVYWQIGSSATLGTTTRFSGNIIAHDSISMDTGAGLIGRAIGLKGAVTMNTNGTPFLANTPLFNFYYVPIIVR